MQYENEATRLAVVLKLAIAQAIAAFFALCLWGILATTKPLGDMLMGAVIAFAISTTITGLYAIKAKGKNVPLIVRDQEEATSD